MSEPLARSMTGGFVALQDATPMNRDHFIRATHISVVRPVWNAEKEWIGCDVTTLDGSTRRVAASVEQILDAISEAQWDHPWMTRA